MEFQGVPCHRNVEKRKNNILDLIITELSMAYKYWCLNNYERFEVLEQKILIVLKPMFDFYTMTENITCILLGNLCSRYMKYEVWSLLCKTKHLLIFLKLMKNFKTWN